jgi:hypothetical protein
MRKLALIARIVAIAVSFLYMILLLPHVTGLGAGHFTNGWSLSGIAVALLWIPLVRFHGQIQRSDQARLMALSFIPLVFVGTCIVALLAATS